MTIEATMFGSEFAVATKLYYGALYNRLTDLDIERYYGLIFYLGTVGKMQTQQQIANQFKMDKTVLVRVIDYLTEKGFVQRVINPNDRRAYFIQLTDLAKEKLPIIQDAINDINKIAFKGFTEEQIADFTSQLQIVKSNLFNEPAIDFELNYK